jgi:hypothetical protein
MVVARYDYGCLLCSRLRTLEVFSPSPELSQLGTQSILLNGYVQEDNSGAVLLGC